MRKNLEVWLRRAGAIVLCLGVWAAGVFLLIDSLERWSGGRADGDVLAGVLAFPFSILVLVGALSLTVRLVRRWPYMGEVFPKVPDGVDKDETASYLNDSTIHSDSEGR
jgi:hypothetical protein